MLLRVLNYIAAPFSSQEWALLNYGVEGVHFNRDTQGVPVLTDKGRAEVLSTWKYITNNPQVLYDTNRSQEYATNIQEDEKAMADVAIADRSSSTPRESWLRTVFSERLRASATSGDESPSQ